MAKATLRTEKYEIPSSIDGICALVREILNGRHVRRIELDTDDKFVRAHRWVEGNDLEEEALTWDKALQNVPNMVEYYSDQATSFQVIVDMMMLAQQDGLYCSCWAVGAGDDLLRPWFDVDGRGLPVGEIQSLLGLPVRRLKSIPRETLILCCSKYPSADPAELSMAIKTSIEMRRDHVERGAQAVGGVGNRPQEHRAGAYPLALSARGLRRVAWNPPGEAGLERSVDGVEFRPGSIEGDHQ